MNKRGGKIMQESGENYLETILILRERNGTVRSIDIANELGYAKPSVSRAVKLLEKKGLIVMEHNGELVLTDKGLEMASAIYERHRIISEFFVDILGVDKISADMDACRIEHVISETSFNKIKEFIKGRTDRSSDSR
ncbi:MAG: metal-dependent transcriptional regulator [Synergistaceae bacterium]|jgi:Mn-dependent DtxR family transcriptional regulator|nr:metal-dependent transcriptional regulator [Synergistaceae bacterium]MDD3318530.1 metal-dependent transcriptional regulator [Synergistaceae bacterium]MDD3963243.1 metal-dependent transcriptional regulator [Synergistaceae bacterium]MDD4704443.1 metal-dependent transcriptional regulator [Synergistaceae bacterium]